MNAPAPRPLPATGWPRVYRPTRAHQVLLGGLGVVTVAGGVGGAAWMSLHPAPDRVSGALLLVPLLPAMLGAFLVAAIRGERLVLTPDAIEFHELGRGSHRFRRDEISGRRVIRQQYGLEQWVLELRERGRKPFKVTVSVTRDDVMDAWWASIPDLEADDLRRSEAALLASAALGATEAERAQSLQRARRTAAVLRVAAIAVAAWGFLAPRPYLLAMGSLAAVLAVAVAVTVTGRGRYSMEGQRNDARPEVVSALVAPGMVLALRVLIDLTILDQQPLLVWAGLGGAGLAALLAWSDAALRGRLHMVAFLALAMGAASWGLLGACNALLDRGAPEGYRVAVLAKRVTTGKNASNYLRLAAFGPLAAQEVTVDRLLYQAVPVGAEVCVELHPGALDLRWLSLDACP